MCWLLDTSFSISQRQVHLIRHHYLHGHGIPAHVFSKEIDILYRPALAAVLSPRRETSVAPGVGAVLAPRWRRRIWLYPMETKNGTSLALAVLHELVAPNDGAEARKRARQYLDNTPYWICPHQRTHVIDAAEIHNNDNSPNVAGWSMRDPECWSFWSGLHARTVTPLNRF